MTRKGLKELYEITNTHLGSLPLFCKILLKNLPCLTFSDGTITTTVRSLLSEEFVQMCREFEESHSAPYFKYLRLGNPNMSVEDILNTLGKEIPLKFDRCYELPGGEFLPNSEEIDMIHSLDDFRQHLRKHNLLFLVCTPDFPVASQFVETSSILAFKHKNTNKVVAYVGIKDYWTRSFTLVVNRKLYREMKNKIAYRIQRVRKQYRTLEKLSLA